MTVTITFNDFPRLIREYPAEAANGVEATAREGERIVKQMISDSPATGITYGSHTASSEGNPPRIDTSNLVNNINSVRLGEYQWAIRSGAEYHAILEFGGRHVAPRPSMGPMAMELGKKAEAIMLEFLRDV